LTSTRATMALMDTVGKVAGKVAKFADDYKDYFHYGLIPAIIVIGMTTTPRPSLSQLLTPV